MDGKKKKPRGERADQPKQRTPDDLRIQLLRIRGLANLGDELHRDPDTLRELERHRADCCGAAYEEALRLMDRFNLKPLPTPHVDPPRLLRVQILAWADERLRELDRKPVNVKAENTTKEITLGDFLREHPIEKLSDARVHSIKARMFREAHRNKIDLPPLARPYKRGGKNYYRPEDLIQRWPEYQVELSELPDLKPEYTPD